MKRSLLLTMTLLIVMPDIASAQPSQDARDRRTPQAGARPSPAPQRTDRPAAGRPTTRPAQPHVRPVPGRPGGSGGPQIQPPRPPRPTPPRPSRPHPPQQRPGAGRPPHFRPITGSPFRYPHGYQYRRWSVGLLLPRLFLSQSYFYDDYARLGVGAPPPGYRWVRYGPDLLLVQTRSGRVADVIYGAFY